MLVKKKSPGVTKHLIYDLSALILLQHLHLLQQLVQTDVIFYELSAFILKNYKLPIVRSLFNSLTIKVARTGCKWVYLKKNS